MYKVTVHPNFEWNSAKVAGRTFTKGTPAFIAHDDMIDQIRNSGVLQISIVEDEPAINATDGAITLAAKSNVDLATIEGTGEGGRITKPDVQAVIDANSNPSD